MLHRGRVHTVTDITCAEELATMLVERTWTLCTGFRHAGLLFLNDSTGPDGAQEYAVVRDGRQVESITFSWCTDARALAIIQDLATGALGADYGPASLHVNTEPGHICLHCA